jgi:hypothetical protein
MCRSLLIATLFLAACTGEDDNTATDGTIETDTDTDTDTDADTDADTDTDTDADTDTDTDTDADITGIANRPRTVTAAVERSSANYDLSLTVGPAVSAHDLQSENYGLRLGVGLAAAP